MMGIWYGREDFSEKYDRMCLNVTEGMGLSFLKNMWYDTSEGSDESFG